eukprot:4972738-Amphidinium_carterae.2
MYSLQSKLSNSHAEALVACRVNGVSSFNLASTRCTEGSKFEKTITVPPAKDYNAGVAARTQHDVLSNQSVAIERSEDIQHRGSSRFASEGLQRKLGLEFKPIDSTHTCQRKSRCCRHYLARRLTQLVWKPVHLQALDSRCRTIRRHAR